MDPETRSFKRKFNTALEPFKVMLMGKRSLQSKNDWIKSVHRIKESALNKPEQYLGQTLPAPSTTNELIHLIFDEFLQEVSWDKEKK